jgi:hypothetical protein
MATEVQIERLRRNINDIYDKDGNFLLEADQTFVDSELSDILDAAFVEVSEGLRTYETAVGEDIPLGYLVAKADAILQIAQDEARRIKWSVNNKVIDPTTVSARLIKIAEQLRLRYKDHMDRKLSAKQEGVTNQNCGTKLTFNTTVSAHSERKFDNTNRNIRRNQPRW